MNITATENLLTQPWRWFPRNGHYLLILVLLESTENTTYSSSHECLSHWKTAIIRSSWVILLWENHELYCGLSFLCHNLKSLYHPGCASSEHILVYFYAFRMVAPKTQRLPRPLLSSPLSNESNRKENWYAGVHANYLIRTALITDWEMFNVSSKIPRFPSWRQCSVNTLETKHGGGGWHPISWIYLVNSLQGSCVVCFSNSIIYSINTYVPCHTHKNISSWS